MINAYMYIYACIKFWAGAVGYSIGYVGDEMSGEYIDVSVRYIPIAAG